MSSNTYPLIKGARPDFASISLNLVSAGNQTVSSGEIVTQSIIDIRSVEYQTRSNARFKEMSSPYPVGRPRGQISASASVEFGLVFWRALLAQWRQSKLATNVVGLTDYRFNMVVSYSLLPGDPIEQDTLIDCRFIEVGNPHRLGPSDLVVSTRLSIVEVAQGSNTTFPIIMATL